MSALELVPITLKEAHAFVAAHHRHHDPDVGGRFAIGAARSLAVVAVAVVGNAKARMLDVDDYTAEVTRLCSIDVARPIGSDGREHAAGTCAFLYAACWRAWRAMGGRRLVTYILPEEGGASLRGAGWAEIGEAGGGSWDRKERPRVDTHPTQMKIRWERVA